MIEITTRENGSGGVLVMINLDGEILGSLDIDRTPNGVRINGYNDIKNDHVGTLLIKK